MTDTGPDEPTDEPTEEHDTAGAAEELEDLEREGMGPGPTDPPAGEGEPA